MYACVYLQEPAPDARGKLIDCVSLFSPLFESAERHILIDVNGLSSMFGPPKEIGRKLSHKIEESGLKANIALASSPEIAAITARGCPGLTVITRGEEAQTISHLPIALLDPDEETEATLASWGIRTLGEFASLPAIGIAERLGPAGVRFHRIAHGYSIQTLVPDRPDKRFSASLQFEHGVDSLEPLSFILSRLLHEVCALLQFESLATNEIQLELTLESRIPYQRAIRLPFATRDAATFLRLLQYDLAAHPPEDEIHGVTLTASPVHPRVVQHGLFLPAAPQPERLELTLARVAAIVGQENVGTPQMLDSYRPGAFHMVRFEVGHPPPKVCEPGNGKAPLLAVRLFRPPLPATVVLKRGRPSRIRGRGIHGLVTSYAGPWRISGDWWTPIAWARDEWDIQLDSGALYRIYSENSRSDKPRAWYIDGNYD